MIRPDHAWVFFTILLTLALAMSMPRRKAETVIAHGPIWEQAIQR
jgi:hypothetical protein